MNLNRALPGDRDLLWINRTTSRVTLCLNQYQVCQRFNNRKSRASTLDSLTTKVQERAVWVKGNPFAKIKVHSTLDFLWHSEHLETWKGRFKVLIRVQATGIRVLIMHSGLRNSLIGFLLMNEKLAKGIKAMACLELNTSIHLM